MTRHIEVGTGLTLGDLRKFCAGSMVDECPVFIKLDMDVQWGPARRATLVDCHGIDQRDDGSWNLGSLNICGVIVG